MSTENKRQSGYFDDYEEYQPVKQNNEETQGQTQTDQDIEAISKISGMFQDVNIS